MSGTAGRARLALRDRHPGSSTRHRLFFEFCRTLCQLYLVGAYRTIELDGQRVPQTGPVLLVANHQSFIDPPAIGIGARPRHLDFIARGGLFSNPAFGRLISALNSIPIREDGGDAAAMKEALRRIGTGRAVLVFPEASRSVDGVTRPFKRGVAVLVRRAGCPVIPVGIEGAFDAWPRTSPLPRLFGHRVAVAYGEPIPHAELKALSPDDAMQRLHDEVEAQRLRAGEALRRATRGRLPGPRRA